MILHSDLEESQRRILALERWILAPLHGAFVAGEPQRRLCLQHVSFWKRVPAVSRLIFSFLGHLLHI